MKNLKPVLFLFIGLFLSQNLWAADIDFDKEGVLDGYTAVSSSNPAITPYIYSDGTGKFSLTDLGQNTGYTLRLKGSTKYKILWFQLTCPDGEEKDIKITPESDGSFDYYYVLKNGKGSYKITVYGAMSTSATSYKGLATFNLTSKKAAPEDLKSIPLNDLMMEYIDDNMGEKIGSGECWDVAQDFLDTYGADWTRTTDFGLPLDPDTDTILPGDIIQFYSVKLYYEDDYSYWYQTLGSPDHTAVVYEVISPNYYMLAHQNVSGKRYIVTSDADLNYQTGGQLWFYRPIMGAIPADWLD